MKRDFFALALIVVATLLVVGVPTFLVVWLWVSL